MLLSLFTFPSFAQQKIQYTDHTYRASIKSVECYNTVKQGSFPVIALRSNEQLLLAFDDLEGRSRNYYYTLEHCDAQWNTSRLSPAEYLQGFMEDRIMDYSYSSGTMQKYIHYEVKLPNQNIAPKLAGNYLLKVYEDSDQSHLIITRRIYVTGTAVSLAAELVPSNNVQARANNQKLNFQVNYGGLNVQNPYNDIKVLVMQNGRPETAQLNTRPTFVRNGQLIYNDFNSNDFAGGNEFRHFDMRTLKLNSERITRIFKDSANTVLLLNDESRNRNAYLLEYDNDGNFFIINQDGRDARTDGDYANVYFSLLPPKGLFNGNVYITGKFNNYEINDFNKLEYDVLRNRFNGVVKLKQGVYDYLYVVQNPATNKPDSTPIEGSYFETENEYQMLVYYRPPGSRWEELVGYKLVSSK
ncbi:type IX secretion system plug protein [Mucilaginibacter terrae]|uniref:type IX secretion system plug protein n=1 Tax=Mucilaginibacter terrae TaxID=1955052 RepID=UPI0035DBD99E